MEKRQDYSSQSAREEEIQDEMKPSAKKSHSLTQALIQILLVVLVAEEEDICEEIRYLASIVE